VRPSREQELRPLVCLPVSDHAHSRAGFADGPVLLGWPGTLKLGSRLRAPVSGSHPLMRDLAIATPLGELLPAARQPRSPRPLRAGQGRVWQPRGETGDRLPFCLRRSGQIVATAGAGDRPRGVAEGKMETSGPPTALSCQGPPPVFSSTPPRECWRSR